MKSNLKALALTIGCLGLLACPVCMSNSNAVAVYADGEEETEEVYECSVVINASEHGEILVDKTEGHVGELVTVNAKHDLFYLVDWVKVNDTALVESETTRGEFTFALVEGENTISAHFIVDAELLGEMSVIYEQAMNKDWTNLFSVENVVRIISFVLSSGLLIAVVRYYIKDKKLEKKVEEAVKKTVNDIIPQTTKDTVTTSVEKVLFPAMEKFFDDMGIKYADLIEAMSVFAKCFALSLEDTPEAKRAIIDELSNLKISDATLVESIKRYIAEQIEAATKLYQEQIAKLEAMSQENKEILGETEEETIEEPVEEPVEEPKEEEKAEEPEETEEKEEIIDDGTQI